MVTKSEAMAVAAIQMSPQEDRLQNVEAAKRLVREAAAAGAQIILLPELFESLYFPQTEEEGFFDWAQEVGPDHSFLPAFQEIARENQVVLPVSFFERAGPSYYNSLAVIDATGDILGVYRKTHIPDGPGYEEKYYFSPGADAPRVYETHHGRLGCGICWDQWFPEVARVLCLQGAELLLYPTAIGSEPEAAGELDTRFMWRRAMIGHAVCNAVPLVAANRCGTEGSQRFYGHSFVADPQGELVQAAAEETEVILHARFDRDAHRRFRAGMGFFRDRRPELYKDILHREC